MKNLLRGGEGGGGGRLILVRNSSKFKYCSLFSKYSVQNKKLKSKKKKEKKKEKHAPLRDSVGRYMREIIIAMFLQIQSDIYTYIYNAVLSFYAWFRFLFPFLWYGNL